MPGASPLTLSILLVLLVLQAQAQSVFDVIHSFQVGIWSLVI